MLRRIVALRDALAHPRSDARAPAAAVWDVLVGPIAADLAAAEAKTILWSLDGVLRYVPTSALWDAGRGRWLVEDYRSALVTPTTWLSAPRARPGSLRVLAAGVTRGHHGLPALSGVDRELRAIVRDAAHPSGALPGRKLVDEAFTRGAWLAQLDGRWPVVHVASHYVMSPTEGSFLLLGDGARLTLQELASAETPLFREVELLALSACDTALGADTATDLTGAELDGLAMVAQLRGAASVLASLYPVNDAATATLMNAFYGRLQDGTMSKAEALQAAQVAMIHRDGAHPIPDPGRGIRRVGAAPEDAEQSHPRHWGAFVLLGSAR